MCGKPESALVCKILIGAYSATGFESKMCVFGVFVCFGLYFVNYRSWQAEILQEHAEGCIQVDLQQKIRLTTASCNCNQYRIF